MKALRIRFFLILFLAPVSQAATDLKPPQIETLPNGMKIAWFLNDRIPMLDLVLYVRAGQLKDPVDKSGTAQLMSEVLSRGSATLSPKEIAYRVEKLGATQSVGIDDEGLTISMHGLSIDTENLLNQFALVALKPDFQKSEIEKQKLRKIDAWRHLGDSSQSLASIALFRVLTNETIYSRNGFTYEKEFLKITPTDVKDFYKNHFSPKNSVLLVVGRADQKEMRKKIAKAFEGWKTVDAPSASVAHTFPALLPKPSEVIGVDRSGLNQATVKFGFRGPSFAKVNRHAVILINALFGEYFNSRLNSVIRDQMALTYSIGSQISDLDAITLFSISAATRNETVGELLKKVTEIYSDLKKNPPADAEIKTAKEYLLGSFSLSHSSLEAIASRWLTGEVHGYGDSYLNEFPAKINALTREDVLTALNAYFPDAHSLVRVVSGDLKEMKKSLTANGFLRIKTFTPLDFK